MKNSLVAGAAGFLGSSLVKKLLKEGHRVIGVDNFATGLKRNLTTLDGHPNFEFIKSSILSDDILEIDRDFNYIFHFASPASPPKYQKLGLETLHANTIGTENLIKLALKHDARFLFSSTSEIYGDPEVTPQPETYWGYVNPIGPRSVYDESKRLGETLCFHYQQNEGLRAGIMRIFNTYGPGMDPYDGRVVSTFIRQSLKNEIFTVFGDGKQTRSFCFVDDLIEGIVRFAESDYFGPFNLGNPLEMNLIEFGEIVARELGNDARFAFMDLPIDDPKQRRPDISMAKEKLFWEPKIDLQTGIRSTAEWIKQELIFRGEL